MLFNSFYNLPKTLREQLLWRIGIEYNSDKKELFLEVFNDCLCGMPNKKNRERIDKFCRELTRQEYIKILYQVKGFLTKELVGVNELICEQKGKE